MLRARPGGGDDLAQRPHLLPVAGAVFVALDELGGDRADVGDMIDDHQPRAIEDVLMEFGESAQDRADRIDVRARREIPSGEEWFAGAGDQRHDAGVAGRIRDGRRLLDGEGEGFGRPRHEILSTAFGRAEYLERSEEHTSELQSLMRISYAVFCLKKKNK